MRKPLVPTQYQHVLPLFAPLDYSLVIRSVIAGNTPAWVFADQPARPSVALIWDRQDALLLAGNNQDIAALAGLRNLLHNHILPEARARGIPELALFFTPDWEFMLPSLLAGLAARPAHRFSYRFPPGPPPNLPPAPASFQLRRMDETLLTTEMENLDQALGWIDSFWHSRQDFQRAGFGYCIVSQNQRLVTSWCLTVFAAGKSCELGVATVPEHRGRGFASLATAGCIRHALQSACELHWHCWADNRPSAAIAEKLGFHQERAYQVYRLATGVQSGD